MLQEPSSESLNERTDNLLGDREDKKDNEYEPVRKK